MRGVLRWRGAATVALGVSLALACDKNEAEAAPPSGSGAVSASPSSSPSGSGEGPAAGSSPGAGASEGVAVPAARCEPTLDAEPTGFFGMRMILRLPMGLDLVEQNPFFARMATGGQATTCGARITFAGVGFLRSSAGLGEVRKTVLRLRGLPPEAISGFEGEQNLGAQASAIYMAAAGSNGEPAAKGWIFLRREREWVYWVIYETRPEDYAGLDMMFRASTQSLLVPTNR